MSAWLQRLPLWLVLAAAVVAVWGPSLDSSFQFDDWSVVVGDPRVQDLLAWWQAMPATRPLTKLLYALGHELGGAPAVFRALNVLLHAANVALVFVLVRRLARRMRTADPAGATRIAACTAAVFGLHPVQTEAVTYIAGGSVVACSTGVLAALLLFLRATDGARPVLWLGGALLAYLVALGARETALVLPIACALCWLAEGARGGRIAGSGLVLLLAASAAAVIAAASFTAYPYLLETSLATRAPLANLLAQGDAISWLLGQLYRWDRLNADPALRPEAGLLPLMRAALLAALLVAAAWQWRARRALAFGVLWFFLWLAPTNSLLARLDLVNERQLYLALIGPAWLLAQGLERLRAGRLVAIGALTLLLAGGTAVRNRVYVDEVSFWQDVTAKSPHNARAANNLGMALAADCQPLAATRAFETAAALAPDDPRPLINRELLERGELPGVSVRCSVGR